MSTLARPPDTSKTFAEHIPNFEDLKPVSTAMEDYSRKGIKVEPLNPLTWPRVDPSGDVNPNPKKEASMGRRRCYIARLAYPQESMVDNEMDSLLKEKIPMGQKRFAMFAWNYTYDGTLKEYPHITQEESHQFQNLPEDLTRIDAQTAPEGPPHKKPRLGYDWSVTPTAKDYSVGERQMFFDAIASGAFDKSQVLWIMDRHARLDVERKCEDLTKALTAEKDRVLVLERQSSQAAEEMDKTREEAERAKRQMRDAIVQKDGKIDWYKAEAENEKKANDERVKQKDDDITGLKIRIKELEVENAKWNTLVEQKDREIERVTKEGDDQLTKMTNEKQSTTQKVQAFQHRNAQLEDENRTSQAALEQVKEKLKRTIEETVAWHENLWSYLRLNLQLEGCYEFMNYSTDMFRNVAPDAVRSQCLKWREIDGERPTKEGPGGYLVAAIDVQIGNNGEVIETLE